MTNTFYVPLMNARVAAEGFGLPSLQIPAKVLVMLHSLGIPATVLLKQYNAHVHKQWRTVWATSHQGCQFMHAVSGAAPGLPIQKLYQGLPRCQCSILMQLHSGHSGLNGFLAKIHTIDSSLYLACNVPETMAHFILTCRHFVTPCHAL